MHTAGSYSQHTTRLQQKSVSVWGASCPGQGREEASYAAPCRSLTPTAAELLCSEPPLLFSSYGLRTSTDFPLNLWAADYFHCNNCTCLWFPLISVMTLGQALPHRFLWQREPCQVTARTWAEPWITGKQPSVWRQCKPFLKGSCMDENLQIAVLNQTVLRRTEGPGVGDASGWQLPQQCFSTHSQAPLQWLGHSVFLSPQA